MVLDDLSHAWGYYALGDGIALAFEFLASTDLEALEPGRHDVDGAHVFALVSDYDTKPRAEGRWEAHRAHLDIQVVHSGQELVGCTGLQTLAAGPYNVERDVLFAQGDGEFFALTPGRFAIFFPHDAHMPGLRLDGAVRVRKIVMKVRLV